MTHFWDDHWWLLIPLGAFTIPLAGIAMGAFATWRHYRSRDRVLETLQVYAQQGKEPPPELLRALGGNSAADWRGEDRRRDGGGAAPNAGVSDEAAPPGERYGGAWSNPEAVRARTEYYTARAAARSARWRAREPIRRWNNAIFLVAGAGALYFAAQHYAANHVLSDRFYVGAIIVGALAAAAVLAAVLATLFWNNAIFLVVGAGALYFAAQHYAADHVLSDRLYVGAIIVGALAAAAVLAAIVTALFRPK